ncbi:hypothetical protein Tco_1294049 [Tanacetum coccineum]
MTDVAIGPMVHLFKTLEIQIGQMRKVLQERGFRSLPSSTETNLRDFYTIEADSYSIRHIGSSQYAIWYDEDVHDLRSVETEFPAIVFDDAFTSKVTHSCEPTVSPLNDNKIDFRVSFDEFDDEDYTVIYDKNSFSYKIIYVNDLKTDLKNDNDKVNMPSFLSPEPTVSCLNDLDFFKDFENEFPAIVYNDALTSKSDFSTEPTLSP